MFYGVENEWFSLLDEVVVHGCDVEFVVVAEVVIAVVGKGFYEVVGMGKVVESVEGLVGDDYFFGGLGNDALSVGLGIAVFGGIGGKRSQDTVRCMGFQGMSKSRGNEGRIGVKNEQFLGMVPQVLG